jgi:hypothetical protein
MILIRATAATIPAFTPNRNMLQGDIKAYTQCAISALSTGLQSHEDLAISSWLLVVSAIVKARHSLQNEDHEVLCMWFKQLHGSLTSWCETKYAPGDCQCGKSVRNLRDHFMADHMIES